MCLIQVLTITIYIGGRLVIGAAFNSVANNNEIIGVSGKGKLLNVKSYPPIENYQSGLYEVYQEPYYLGINQQAAVAVLIGEEDEGVKGEVVFVQKHPPVGPVFIRGNITGLAPGKHGLHIHQAGDLREGCDKLGGHFDPYLLHHGGLRSTVRHIGDLGNVDAKEDGVGEIVAIDPLMSLSGGPRGIIGRALVVSENEDDLGQAGNANSLVDGNAGKAVACGIIAYIR